MSKDNERFIRIQKESRWAGTNEIWVDRQTGVQYLFHASGYAGGLCVLVDANGKPIITKMDDYSRVIP